MNLGAHCRRNGSVTELCNGCSGVHTYRLSRQTCCVRMATGESHAAKMEINNYVFSIQILIIKLQVQERSGPCTVVENGSCQAWVLGEGL